MCRGMPGRDLRLDFAGRTYRWFDVDEMTKVHGASLTEILSEEISQYFKVPVEYQILCDSEGPLVTLADLRRLLLRSAPRLWLFDARLVHGALRVQCEKRLEGLRLPVDVAARNGAAGAPTVNAQAVVDFGAVDVQLDEDADVKVLAWAASWQLSRAGDEPPPQQKSPPATPQPQPGGSSAPSSPDSPQPTQSAAGTWARPPPALQQSPPQPQLRPTGACAPPAAAVPATQRHWEAPVDDDFADVQPQPGADAKVMAWAASWQATRHSANADAPLPRRQSPPLTPQSSLGDAPTATVSAPSGPVTPHPHPTGSSAQPAVGVQAQWPRWRSRCQPSPTRTSVSSPGAGEADAIAQVTQEWRHFQQEATAKEAKMRQEMQELQRHAQAAREAHQRQQHEVLRLQESLRTQEDELHTARLVAEARLVADQAHWPRWRPRGQPLSARASPEAQGFATDGCAIAQDANRSAASSLLVSRASSPRSTAEPGFPPTLADRGADSMADFSHDAADAELQRLREVLVLATEKKEHDAWRWRVHEEHMAAQVTSQRREIDELHSLRHRLSLEAAEAAQEERNARLRQEVHRWRQQEERNALQVIAQRDEIEELRQRCRAERQEAEMDQRGRLVEVTQEWRHCQQEASVKEAKLRQEMQDLQLNAQAAREAQQRQQHEVLRLQGHVRTQEDELHMARLVAEQDFETHESEIQELLFAAALQRQNALLQDSLREELEELSGGGGRQGAEDAARRAAEEEASALQARRAQEVLEGRCHHLASELAERDRQLQGLLGRAADGEEVQELRRREARAVAEVTDLSHQMRALRTAELSEMQLARQVHDRDRELEELRQRHQDEVGRLVHEHRAAKEDLQRRLAELSEELERARRPAPQEGPPTPPAPSPREPSLPPRRLSLTPAATEAAESWPPPPRPALAANTDTTTTSTTSAATTEVTGGLAGDYVATADDELDVALERCITELGPGCLGGTLLVRSGKGYKFGSKRLFVKLDGEEVKVRHGSSFVPFAEWLRLEAAAGPDE